MNFKNEEPMKNSQLYKGSLTTIVMKLLDENGRIVAIAEMLSGKNPSEAALLNAKNLLEIQSA